MLLRRWAHRSSCCTSSNCKPSRPASLLRSSMTSNTAEGPDTTNSFISQFKLQLQTNGPLAGRTLCVKDLFDVAGHTTGFGHPLWAQTHPVPHTTAPPVQVLLEASAIVVGKTHMDELAYSLNGENHHYGTPLNVAAPGCIPGGSSSGSAAAVAAKQADIGLGSDTGGSVRVPASFCGLFGMRPTHGRISLHGACPLAPSFDTVGWFTRDALLMEQVGQVLFASDSCSQVAAPGRPPAASPPANTGGSSSSKVQAAAAQGSSSTTSSSGSSRQPDLSKPHWLVGKDAFALASPEASQAIYNALSGDAFEAVTAILGPPTEVDVASCSGLQADGLDSFDRWFATFRVCQGWEIWQEHGAWVTQHQPEFGPGTKERFEWVATLTQEQWRAEDANRTRLATAVHDLLGVDGVLAIPTAPGPAIPINCPADKVDAFRKSLLCLTSIAGLAGCPQVTLPIATVGSQPIGLSLIGPRNSDEQLLQLARRLAAAVQPPS